MEALARGNSQTAALMTAIGTLYLSDMHKRYRKFSKGGGNWKKLKPATVKRKGRTGKKSAKVKVNTKKTGGRTAILVDKGQLIASIAPGSSDSIVRMKNRKAVRAGYKAGAKAEGGKITIRELADIHQKGNPTGGLPARPIFVEPTRPAKRRMIALIKKAIEQSGGPSHGRR